MKRKWALPYFLTLPAVTMLVLITIFPLFWSFYTSTREMTLFDLMMRESEPAGFGNYIALFEDPYFWNALKNSLIFVGISVFGQVFFGLLLANVLHSKLIRAPGFFRAIYLIPWIASSVIVGYSWIYLLDANLGLLPSLSYQSGLLRAIGLGRRDWLTNPSLVIFVLSIINIWKGTPFSMLMQSAGFQSIPDTVYEAAKVDGANVVQRFSKITLPLIMPFLLINLVMTTMTTFNVYDVILVITGGGPARSSELLSLFVYNVGFERGQLGYSAAASTVLLIINVAITFFYLRYIKPKEMY
jgi:ABC-type sugar transport system permease subunit